MIYLLTAFLLPPGGSSTVQCSTIQYSAVYSTVQCSAVQYSTVQYSTHLHTKLIERRMLTDVSEKRIASILKIQQAEKTA